MEAYKDKISKKVAYKRMKFDRDFPVLVRTAKGETNGLPAKAAKGVVFVILNRVIKQLPHWGLNVHDVCKSPEAFSYWSKTTLKYLSYYYIKELIPVVVEAIEEWLSGEDFTNGATHYHRTDIMPYWAQGMAPCYNDGHHVFYNNIK